jgi:molecular chaperone GrpE (heat shock protein)
MAQNQKPLFPQNKERLKRGITSTPIRYKVLQITMLPQHLKIEMMSKLATINTGDQAKQLAGQPPGWGYRHLDTLGRIGVLSLRGVEVAVFFKRQMQELEVEDCDPVPEGEIKDPVDVWVRLDVLGLSARQVNARVKQQLNTLLGQSQLNETQLKAKEQIIETQAATIKRLEASLKAAEDEATRKRTEPGKHREMGQRDVMEGFLELLASIQMGADDSLVKEPKLFKMLDTMGKKVIVEFQGEVIAPHCGDDFDPTLHEAIAPDPNYSENKISRVGAFGMKMHDVLVKPARVIVGIKKPEEEK